MRSRQYMYTTTCCAWALDSIIIQQHAVHLLYTGCIYNNVVRMSTRKYLYETTRYAWALDNMHVQQRAAHELLTVFVWSNVLRMSSSQYALSTCALDNIHICMQLCTVYEVHELQTVCIYDNVFMLNHVLRVSSRQYSCWTTCCVWAQDSMHIQQHAAYEL